MKRIRRTGVALLGLGVVCVLLGYVMLLPAAHLALQPEICVMAAERSPGGGADSESIFVLFPAGLACTWHGNDGSVHTVYFGAWEISALLCGGVLSGVAGVVLLLLPPRRKEPAQEQPPG